ncbi:MAG: hypothetical protein GF313_09265 [Caldithrix sp.]|nr:hypothetical protein [Caldithrix sp.]
MRNQSGLIIGCILCLTILYHHLLIAQPAISRNSNLSNDPLFRLNFQKQSTTWNWLGRFSHQNHESSSAWYWQVNETFESNLLIPSVGKKQWKDENHFRARFLIKHGDWRSGIYTRSWLQSDRQVSLDNRFGNHAIGLKSQLDPNQHFTFTPYMGYQQSRNRKITDWGWDVGIDGETRNLRLGQYRTDINAKSEYDFYDKRQNFQNQFDIRFGTRFTDFARDSLSFSFQETSKQYYAADSKNLLQVKLYDRHFRNKLLYNITPRNLLTVNTRIQSRYISYFSGRNVFLIENNVRFLHFGNRFNYVFSFRSNEETQDNAESFTDSQAKRTALGTQLGYRFNNRQSIHFDIDYIKLQYDTPDDENFDDRDEQRFILNLDYHHRFSPYLKMEWFTYAYLFHQIYIFKERSNNNNWNQVFKLNPRIHYEYKRLKNTLSTEILANYTIYDFENGQQVKSFVFRKYTLSDSIRYRAFGRVFLGLFGRIELEDKGSFFKEDFAQQIVQSYRSYFLNGFIENRYFLKFKVRLGYTRYMRKEWRHLPQKQKYREVINHGPYLNISYDAPGRMVFSAHSSLNLLEDSRGPSSRYGTGYLRLYYNL